MSKYAINKRCDMCNEIEVGLTELTIGNIKHHICYNCMADLVVDIVNFARANLQDEIRNLGYDINIETLSN